MSTLQSDVGRQSKVVLIGGCISLLAICYLVYSYATPAKPAQSSVGTIQTSRGVPGPESAHYGEVLQKYNIQNAAAAEQAGNSYLSVFSARPQAVPPPAENPAPTAEPAPAPPVATPISSVPAAARDDSRMQQRLAEQGQALMNNWVAVAHTSARVGEGVASPAPAANSTPEITAQPRIVEPPPVTIIPGFTLVPATLRTDIDTDETSTVEANISTGPYAGASVYAPGYKRMNNSVDMTFTHMTWNGRTYKIHAKPVDQHTMRSALSGEVNNRYASRVLLPALALGLGRAGQLFEQAGTQTIIGPFGGVIQTRNGTPSGRTIAGAMVGGVATEAGQVMRGDAAQLPVKQVLVARDETIGVRFIEPVFANDEIRSAQQQSATAPGEARSLTQ